MKKITKENAHAICPKCGGAMKKNGKTNNNCTVRVQKYKCNDCSYCGTLTGQVGRPRSVGICSHENCTKEVRVKGLCKYHYQKQWCEANGLTRGWYRLQDRMRINKKIQTAEEIIKCL